MGLGSPALHKLDPYVPVQAVHREIWHHLTPPTYCSFLGYRVHRVVPDSLYPQKDYSVEG